MEFFRREGVTNSMATRCNAACTLFLVLCALVGCKKEDKPKPQPAAANGSVPAPATPVTPPQSATAKSTPLVSLTDRNAQPTVLASPPPDMFDLKAHPDASILTAMDINKLSDSERQLGSRHGARRTSSTRMV